MNDPKEKARTLYGRLSKGLDLILEAKSAGDDKKAESLQALYNRLEDDYLEAKKSYSKTPEDLLRCPDCPHLGEGLLADGVICDIPCREAGTK
ncbi:MAG: hypothetical protein BWX67_02253 [Thermotogae bacterium ADurb.Bin062]|nr:MAG: hypothetical protein BWX67_02253 [Thermotogota bacterium ADurb.Bin062]